MSTQLSTPYSFDKTKSSKMKKSGKSSDSSFEELIDEINDTVSNSLSIISDEEETKSKSSKKLKSKRIFKPSSAALKRSETFNSSPEF